MATTIHLGGLQAADEERIYPKDARFTLPDGQRVIVKRSSIPRVNMADLFARHRARYCQVGLFCRPGHRVLDLPCGSGYGAEMLAPFGVIYEGLDIDKTVLTYAKYVYGAFGTFRRGDLCNPQLPPARYDVIGCIEGLEHIPMSSQDALIAACKQALKPGGILVVSSPENPSGHSGQSLDNKYHTGELTRTDFLALLGRHFPAEHVELVTHRATLSTGRRGTCFYGICHNE